MKPPSLRLRTNFPLLYLPVSGASMPPSSSSPLPLPPFYRLKQGNEISKKRGGAGEINSRLERTAMNTQLVSLAKRFGNENHHQPPKKLEHVSVFPLLLVIETVICEETLKHWKNSVRTTKVLGSARIKQHHVGTQLPPSREIHFSNRLLKFNQANFLQKPLRNKSSAFEVI